MKIVEGPGGFLQTLVFDWASGGFLDDDSYFEAIFTNPFKDVDSFSKDSFDLRVQMLRAPIVESLLATPMAWEHTGDGVIPYAARANDRVFTIRINDFPEEPLYTLIVNGEDIVDLEEWPQTWDRAPIPQALLDTLGLRQRKD